MTTAAGAAVIASAPMAADAFVYKGAFACVWLLQTAEEKSSINSRSGVP